MSTHAYSIYAEDPMLRGNYVLVATLQDDTSTTRKSQAVYSELQQVIEKTYDARTLVLQHEQAYEPPTRFQTEPRIEQTYNGTLIREPQWTQAFWQSRESLSVSLGYEAPSYSMGVGQEI